MPLSQQESELLQSLKAEVARRMESSNAAPAQPSAPVAQPSSDAQLQSAVNDAKNIGYARASAAGGGGGFMTSPAIPEDVARETGLGILTTTARVAPVLAAGALTGGAGLIPAAAAMGLASGIGETAGQLIESGKITDRGAIAGSAAAGLVPFGGQSTSLAKSLLKSGASSVGGGLAYRTSKALANGEQVSAKDIAEGGPLDLAVGIGLQGLGVLGGAAYRTAKSGEPGVARLIGEIQAPFEAEIIRRNAEKLSKFAESGPANELIAPIAGQIAQASRQDPKAIADFLKQSMKNGATSEELIAAINKGVGKLDEEATNAVRQFAGSYEAMASQDLSSAANFVKQKADQQLVDFKAKSKSLYDEIDSNPLFNEKRVGRVAGEDVYGVPRGKSINDLREELTNAYNAIDYTKPVQGATGDRYAEVARIKKELNSALESLPKDNPIVDKYKEAQAFYGDNIGRFKGSYANSILRDIGEEGGGESTIITRLGGTDGAKYLSELKNLFRDGFNEVRDSIGQQIYKEMSSGGPRKLVDNVEKAMNGEWKGVQPSVIKEFLPLVDAKKINAAKASIDIADKAFNKDFTNAIEKGGDLNNVDVDSLISWFKGKDSYRAEQARKYLGSAPELLADAQNSLLSKIISDSAEKTGVVTGDSLRSAAGNYKETISGLIGERGNAKIEGIAAALDQASKDASKTSILGKLIPVAAGVSAATKVMVSSGNIAYAGTAATAAAYTANKAMKYANAQAAAYLLSSPKYRAAITKPYEDLTNRETKMLENDLPGIISKFSY